MKCSLLAILIAVAIAYGVVAASESCVTVRVTNCYSRTVSISNGPVTLCAEVRVRPDKAHRILTLELDYAEPERSMSDLGEDEFFEPEKQDGPVLTSDIQLNTTESESTRHDRRLAGIYGGTYVVTATVYVDDSRAKVCHRATTRVKVL